MQGIHIRARHAGYAIKRPQRSTHLRSCVQSFVFASACDSRRGRAWRRCDGAFSAGFVHMSTKSICHADVLYQTRTIVASLALMHATSRFRLIIQLGEIVVHRSDASMLRDLTLESVVGGLLIHAQYLSGCCVQTRKSLPSGATKRMAAPYASYSPFLLPKGIHRIPLEPFQIAIYFLVSGAMPCTTHKID